MKRLRLILSIGIFILACCIYENMAPLKLSSANMGTDGGDYLAAVLTNGIPHPTGYPLYLLLSIPLQKMAVNTSVWRQAQLSILPGVLAVVLVYFLVIISINEKTAALKVLIGGSTAAVLLALAPVFWSQAVIIEVYALNAFFICLAAIWLFIVLRTRKFRNAKDCIPIILLSWGCGLGLGNHITFALFYPAVIFGLWQLHHNGVPKWIILLCGLGWLSGLLTYLILPIRAQLHPLVNWGNPETWDGFFWLVRGGDYNHLIFGIKPSEYPTRILSWINLIVTQFGVFGVLAGLVGISSARMNRSVKWATLYLFFIYSIFAIGYKTNDSLVYIIPSLIIFAIWCGWGIYYLLGQKWKKLNIGVLLAVAIGINLIVVFQSRYASVAPTNADLAQYAETTLTEAQENAVLFPEDDGQTFSLWFYQYGLGIRPDVKIVSRGLLQYPWYRENLQRIYPDINFNTLN